MKKYNFGELNDMALNTLKRLGLLFPTEAQIQCTERFLLEVVLAERHGRNTPLQQDIAKNEHNYKADEWQEEEELT